MATPNLEGRVLLLERQLRTGWTVICLLAILAIVGWAQDRPVPVKVQAKEFELVDAGGNVLARIGSEGGSGTVTTFDKKGQMLVDIIPTAGGSGGLVVYGATGKQNLVITDVKDGGGNLRVNNSVGTTVVSVGRNVSNGGSITVHNKGGRPVVSAANDTSEAGTVTTYTDDGKETGRVPGLKSQ